MSNNTIPEIPEEFQEWVSQWLFKHVESVPIDLDEHVRVTTFCRAIVYQAYRHLYPLLGGSGKWIPLSERLPEVGICIPTKCPDRGKHCYDDIFVYKDGSIKIGSTMFINAAQVEEWYPGIAWLEEIESALNSSQTDKTT